MAIVHGKTTTQSCPRVLVVDDEPMLAELFREIVARSIDCNLLFASNLDEARQVLTRQPIDVLVADIYLPDGNGLELLNELYERQPSAAALVISGSPSVDGAVAAMRSGAVDFVPKPFTAEEIAEHIRTALTAQRTRQHREDRQRKLRDAIKRLNAARKMVNKKVDLLCNDLIGAYSELSRQFDTVRLQEGYRQFTERAKDLEQLLCHSMDWLLRQVGYSNIGVWLTSSDGELQLGAFMKYTVAAESDFTTALERNLLRLAVRRNFVRLREPDLQATLTPPELKYLANQDIMAINCTYLGECLGVLLLFRDQKTPFTDDDMNAVKAIAPVFAVSLTQAVKGMEGSGGGGLETEDDPKPKGKTDPSDWWKNGEAPPF
ncbi:MAG: response regulator [Bacillota bacterium]